jgi:peroxiredoxin Q/BCP
MEEQYAKEKYPIYYDQTKKVPNMLKQEVNPIKLGRMPALIVVDKEGVIQYAHYGDSMQDIPKEEEVFEVLKKLKN